MTPSAFRKIAAELRAAVHDPEHIDLDAIGMAARRIEAQAEMIEVCGVEP